VSLRNTAPIVILSALAVLSPMLRAFSDGDPIDPPSKITLKISLENLIQESPGAIPADKLGDFRLPGASGKSTVILFGILTDPGKEQQWSKVVKTIGDVGNRGAWVLVSLREFLLNGGPCVLVDDDPAPQSTAPILNCRGKNPSTLSGAAWKSRVVVPEVLGSLIRQRKPIPSPYTTRLLARGIHPDQWREIASWVTDPIAEMSARDSELAASSIKGLSLVCDAFAMDTISRISPLGINDGSLFEETISRARVTCASIPSKSVGSMPTSAPMDSTYRSVAAAMPPKAHSRKLELDR
jgi:hypothetical protein